MPDIIKRPLQNCIIEDIKKKMVFLAGPRQVGKTTLCKQIGNDVYTNTTYLNWDRFEDHRPILEKRFPAETDLLIFDELHKYRHWKKYLKGMYDSGYSDRHILVSGSAKLDVYRRGGDSLLGRYELYRLHPFSVAELCGIQSKVHPFKALHFSSHTKEARQHFDTLYEYGGFPEPFIAQSARRTRRSQIQRFERLIREDIRDLTQIRDLAKLEQMTLLLPERTGSLLSLNALREEIEVSHRTLALWMDVLEQFYIQIRIPPYTKKIARSLKKEPKLYLWDWTLIKDPAKRLENIVALHLLKFVHYLHDYEGYAASLHFLRDFQGHEVDFLVAVDGHPWFVVEAKQSDLSPSKHLNYFRNRINIPFCYQVVKVKNVDIVEKDIRIMSVEKFLSGLV